jgi:acyl dehydratase
MSATTLRFDQVKPGDVLPSLPIDLTVSLIVAGAVASQDYTPVHHDKLAAQAAGMQDVFMNILTTNGLVSRFVTDWAGPDARITNLSVKLGTPNLPGDTMTLTGSVRECDAVEKAVVVDLVGKNGWGNHVTGSVRVILPAGA